MRTLHNCQQTPARTHRGVRTLFAAISILSLGLTGCGDAEQKSDKDTPTVTANPAAVEAPQQPVEPVPAPASTKTQGSEEVYSYNLPEEYPLAFATWTSNLPADFHDLVWASELEGVGSPIRTITLAGRPYLFGSVCEPHNCGNNHVGFLMRPDQSRVAGFVQVTDDRSGAASLTPVGDPSREEQMCLMKLKDDYEATTC